MAYDGKVLRQATLRFDEDKQRRQEQQRQRQQRVYQQCPELESIQREIRGTMGEIIASAHNTRETEKNALHHAELLAIDAACKKLGGWRLWQCELFVTLEPCPMCSGGIINSRIRRVVYGAADTKAGCCGSVTDLFALPFNHHPVVERGLRAEEAQALLQAFFLRLREQRAAKPRWKPPVTP